MHEFPKIGTQIFLKWKSTKNLLLKVKNSQDVSQDLNLCYEAFPKLTLNLEDPSTNELKPIQENYFKYNILNT